MFKPRNTPDGRDVNPFSFPKKKNSPLQLVQIPHRRAVQGTCRAFPKSATHCLLEQDVNHVSCPIKVLGAPGRFRGSFPDIHNAKVELATPEGFGHALTARFEFKPLQPLQTAVTKFVIDAGELLGFKGAPALVLNPDPPFFGGLGVLGWASPKRNDRVIKWNPQLELDGITDGGTEWELRYSVANDGAVFRAVEGEGTYCTNQFPIKPNTFCPTRD